jgi:Transposase IS66 family/RNase_H superfamily
LLDVLSKYDAPAIFCYGNYETAFVKRMRKHAQRKKPVDELLDAMINILSTIYSHFYFPTYSNGLKEVGSVLGCSWSSADASGIQSITWRIRWDRTHNDCWKTKLIEYNLQDCSALRRVTDFLLSACTWTPALPNPSCHNAVSPMVAQVQELDGFAYSQKWGRPTFVHPDFEFVNKCAYFDYQRQRVFIRTSRTLKKNRRTPGRRRNAELRVSRRIDITASKCPNCGDTKLKELPRGERIKGTYTVAKRAFDVVTTPTGMRRQVIECTATGYRCTQCGNRFISQRYHRLAKYFHGLMSWATYQHVAHRLSTRSLQELFREFFGLVVGKSDIHMFQSVMARYYRSTYQKLLAKMISGPLLHIDETEVKLRTGKGYVWVFTSLEEVVYMYRPTREGKFLPEMLKNFEGVLVSDFYVAYDALSCPQQKCLIHLIRDMNQELLNNPYDMEFQTITLPFGSLLRSIVATADEHGLKGRHLKRHGSEVAQFFEALSAQSFHSDAAQALQKRLIKYRSKLFSFIEHDGVPWNNNNAENAIKGFARYRDGTVGVLSEGGLTDYLVLLSIYQTCRYKGLSFLKFLLSHMRDVDKFCAGKLAQYPLHEVELYPKGYTPPHLVRLRRLNEARSPAATENSPI